MKSILIVLLFFSFFLFEKTYSQGKIAQNFNFKIDSSFTQAQEIIEYISFENPNGLLVTGLIVRPIKKGNFPLVIFQHNEHQNKEQFLQEALVLAQNEMICLLMDAPNWCKVISKQFNTQDYTYIYREAIANIRLSITILEKPYQIKEKHIAFVGDSYGANIGAILTAQEPKIQYFILFACMPKVADLHFKNQTNIQKTAEFTPKERFDLWTSPLDVFDAKNYLPDSKAKILFQYAEKKEIFDTSQTLYALTPEPKSIQYFDTESAMDGQLLRERVIWLLENLKR